MKKGKFLFILIILILLPNFTWAKIPSQDKIERVISSAYMGQGGLHLDRTMNRAELATVAIRLMGLEDDAEIFNKSSPFKDVKSFQGGWASPYIDLAYEKTIIQGTSPSSFNPQGQISYIDMLTIFMRILGYQDGIDLLDYPEGYYIKSIELGMGDLYSDYRQKVNRGDVALSIEQLLDIKLKDEDMTLIEKLHKKPKPIKKKDESIKITNKNFNTSISGVFTGQLTGLDDFSQYRVQLISKKDKKNNYEIYEEVNPEKNGIFKIWNFDISLTARLRGYEYKVYDEYKRLVLEGKLD